MTIWLDGSITARDDAKVSIYDHGLLYGDGAFEGIRLYDGRVFRLYDHARRLETGCRALGLDVPGGAAHFAEIVLATCRAHDERDAYIRLVVTRGEGALGVDPASCGAPTIFCIVDRIALFSEETRRVGVSLLTSSYRKPGPDALDPRVKSLNYLNSVLAKQEAKRRGADEALVLNARGAVAEASVANVFTVRDGVLRTPPVTDGALEGITRDSVLALAARLGIEARVETLGRHDFFGADEAFLSGTGAKLLPIASLDGAPIGSSDRPVLARIAEAFEAFIVERGVPI